MARRVRQRFGFFFVIMFGTATLAAAAYGAAARGERGALDSPQKVTSESAQSGGSLSFAFDLGWDVLDPGATAFTYARQIMQFIYDPLLRRNPKTGEIAPGLAQSWTVSKDQRAITLHLRRGVTFHDGTPFNAQSVVFSFNRLLDPALKSPWKTSISGPTKNFKAVDDYTVLINLKAPFAPFFDSLTQVNLAPVSPAAVAKFGKSFGANPVGTGAWKFDSQTTNDRLTLVANPDYKWAPSFYKHQGPPYVQTLVFRNIPQAATRMALLQTGGINVVYSPVPSQIARYRSDPKYRVVEGQQPGMPRVVVLTTDKWPMTNVNVRRAISYAFDRQALLKSAYGDVGSVAKGILSPNVFGYSKKVAKTWPNYNPAKAKAILKADGWVMGSGGVLAKDGRELKIKMGSVGGSQNFVIQNQIFQANLKAIGIEVSIEIEEQAAYLAHLRAGKWPMAGMLFVATDPDVLHTVLHSSSIGASWNSAHYRNPTVDRLLIQGRTTTNSAKRAAIYEKVQAIISREAPYVPYYNIANAFPMNSYIQDFGLDRQGFWDVYDTWIKR